MFVIDDPLMALILRFVVDTGGPGTSSEEFLQGQLKVLRRYLARFPQTEHRARAIEWVAEHAARYRRDWERNAVAGRTQYLRCADCPLADIGASEHCEIHEQWLYLLHRYLANEAGSREYIEDALSLLQDYKGQHRQRLRVAAVSTAVPKVSAPDRKKKKKQKKKKKEGKGKKGRA